MNPTHTPTPSSSAPSTSPKRSGDVTREPRSTSHDAPTLNAGTATPNSAPRDSSAHSMPKTPNPKAKKRALETSTARRSNTARPRPDKAMANAAMVTMSPNMVRACKK